MAYEDEIFYSWMARYLSNTLTTSQYAAKELFDDVEYEFSFDLPNKISLFAEKIAHLQDISGEDILQKSTLWPFYSVFLRKTTRIEMHVSLKNLARKNFRKTIRQKFEPPTVPKYCYVCMVEDKEKYGEFYWHRSHQIPYMYLCPIHLCCLETCEKNISGSRKGELLLPSLENCPIKTISYNRNPWICSITLYLEKVLNGSSEGFFYPQTKCDDEEVFEFLRNQLSKYHEIRGRMDYRLYSRKRSQKKTK